MHVLVAEDSQCYNELIAQVCREVMPNARVTSAFEAEVAKTLCCAKRFDLLLLDIELPDGDGFEVLRVALETTPSIRVLIVSNHCDDYNVYRAKALRVSGFFDKRTTSLGDLRRSIAAVAAGKSFFSPSFQRIDRARTRNSSSFDKVLSDREITVLSSIAVPMSDREIAAEMGLSAETVEKHRFNILRKLNQATTTRLIRFARDRGLCRYGKCR